MRLNEERQKKLEPKRILNASMEISDLNLDIISIDDKQIQFRFKGETVTYFPYSGWATGKSIKDGRGLKNLIKQLT